MKLSMTASPHIRGKDRTERIMADVVIALLPAVISGTYFFGLRALLLVLTSAVAAPLNMHIDRAAVGTLLYRVIYNASAIITKSLHNYPLQIFIKQLNSVAIISLEVIVYMRD